MPHLEWTNKAQAIAQAADVPYHLLRFERSYGDANADNLLIRGDNLLALKALLPFYRGRVKCIYIDPPYNTQSAFEHYDDKLEHSQWLSLMYPRLVLLRMLAEEGSIWVSIDDNEGHYLKVIMDEVFGRNNFLANIPWQSRYSRSNDATLSLSHNHVIVYAINPNRWKVIRNRLPRTEEQAGQYKNPDNDPRGPWRAIPWDAPNIRENLSYPITTPTGKVRRPPVRRCWSRAVARGQRPRLHSGQRVIPVALERLVLALRALHSGADGLRLLVGLDHEAAAVIAQFPDLLPGLRLDGLQAAQGQRRLDVRAVPKAHRPTVVVAPASRSP